MDIDDDRNVFEAYMFAYVQHKEQKCVDGSLYFKHLKDVYDILCRLTDDTDVLKAGLLHDTLEKTNATYPQIAEKFGHRTAWLVYELTDETSDDAFDGHWFPNLESAEAIMIKFADRLSNISRMRTAWDESRQKHYLRKSRFWKKSKNDRITEFQKDKPIEADGVKNANE